LDNIERTGKSNPCPCCSDIKGKCGVTEKQFDTPYTSSKIYVEGDLVFCMNLRGDTDTHKFTGETQNGLWGKYISWELSEELSQEWKSKKDNKSNVVQKPRTSELAKLHQKRREKKLEDYKINRLREQKILLAEDKRDLEIRKVLKHLMISDRDFKSIKKRGFSKDDIIDYQYKTLQIEQPLSQNVSPFLAGVNKEGSSLNNKVSGLLLPIKNNRNKYVGWQYRPHVTGKSKYLWPKSEINNRDYHISAKQKENWELPLAYCLPKSEVSNKSIGLAEGAGFKPQLAAIQQKQVVLGAAGGMLTQSPKTFSEYLKAASEITGTKDVLLYPDSDAVGNPHILRRYSKTVDFLKEEGYSVKIGWWYQTNKDNHPDIDEINAGVKIKQIDAKDFFMIGELYSGWHPDNEEDHIKTIKLKIPESKIAEEFSQKLIAGINREDTGKLNEVISQYKEKSKNFDSLKATVWTKHLTEDQQSKLKTLLTKAQEEKRKSPPPVKFVAEEFSKELLTAMHFEDTEQLNKVISQYKERYDHEGEEFNDLEGVMAENCFSYDDLSIVVRKNFSEEQSSKLDQLISENQQSSSKTFLPETHEEKNKSPHPIEIVANKYSKELLAAAKADNQEQLNKVVSQYKTRYNYDSKNTTKLKGKISEIVFSYEALSKRVKEKNLSKEQIEKIDRLKRKSQWDKEQSKNINIQAVKLTSPQQQQVEKIAPVLIDYLNLNKKYLVENSKTKIEYNPNSQTLQYHNKENSNEYLLAEFEKGKWRDRGSKISPEKESYFLNDAVAKIDELKKSQRAEELSPTKTKIRKR